ncbi:U11/U12 small nuclear ribonucleoprotein 25 kDa protein [Plodia interpunctella]|uniref:U11/U12 small nuclear ribonucleoprotein 25 kDa protein n=1 Tax=Plodia interpunctella TaxID=58824 RepID=UPI0023677F65|nr:U11/U12 small nuclear ribonucleoprotein 25 kDa protein [Plodia interpunctella]
MEDISDLASTLTHDEIIEVTKSTLSTLIISDPLLSDLPPDIVLEEVLAQTAVEHGQSITIFISRDDEPMLKVIVPQSATVSDLKKAIARHFELYQKRTGSKVKVSWKYVWRTYDLNFEGIILDDNCSKIDNYGVTNKVTLTFKKRKKKRKI